MLGNERKKNVSIKVTEEEKRSNGSVKETREEERRKEEKFKQEQER